MLTPIADSKKRPRPVEAPKAKSEPAEAAKSSSQAAEEEDVGPMTKRQRKTRKILDDDDEESMEEAPPKEKVKGAAAKGSKSEEAAPAKKSANVKESKDEEEPAETAAPESSSEAEPEEDEEADDEDEKPEVAAKAREEMKEILKSKAPDPYPDWKAGDPVPYAALCKTFSLIELTTKRLAMMEHCSLFLRQVLRLTPEDLLPTLQLMINKLAPDYAGIELGIGESLIMKAIGETTGRSLQTIKADQREIGDLGLVAVKSRSTQPTMFKPKPLTVRGVHKVLMDIATVTGNGAQQKKVDLIKKLLSAADASSSGKVDITKDKGGPSEAKFIIRFLEGKLRLGLAEKTALVSLAQAVVCHEAEKKGKIPSTTQMENAESILKTVYR